MLVSLKSSTPKLPLICITAPIGAAASIQLATATPNFLIMESIKTWDGFHSEVLQEPINWSNGYIIPSTKPGLGIELNLDVVESHSPYKGKKTSSHYGFKSLSC